MGSNQPIAAGTVMVRGINSSLYAFRQELKDGEEIVAHCALTSGAMLEVRAVSHLGSEIIALAGLINEEVSVVFSSSFQTQVILTRRKAKKQRLGFDFRIDFPAEAEVVNIESE